MNYINEINNFRKYIAINPLPAYAQALWYLLMHINNTCGWIEWFKVSNSRLADGLCINEKTMRNQRDILVERGIVLYESQRRKKNSGKYKLVSLDGLLEKINIETTVSPTVDLENKVKSTVSLTVDLENKVKTTVSPTVDLENKVETTVSPTVDLKTTVQTTVPRTVDCKTTVSPTVVLAENQKTTVPDTDITKRYCCNNISTTTTMDTKFKEVLDFFNINFHAITEYETKKLKSWLDEFSPGVLLLALEISVESGVRTMKYLEGILRNWVSKNLKTIENIKADQLEFDKKNNTQGGKVINLKPNKFHDFNQRKKYTNDELEKKLGIRK